MPETIGKYEIIEKIGRGGFATVYRARDTRMGREVALKVIAGNFTQEPAFTERFRQEALTAASLRHPNIVTVYDYGEEDDLVLLADVMDWARPQKLPVVVFPGAGHFFHGALIDLQNLVMRHCRD